MDLIETLVNDLSVKQEQAKGGVSLLFQLAKQNLGEGEFSAVAKLVPGMEEMLAPAADDGIMRGVWQKMRLERGSESHEFGMRNLVGGFLRLGLDCGSIDKFVPFIVSYVRRKGGDAINNLSEQDLR